MVAWERPLFLSAEAIEPNPRHVDLWQKRATAFKGLTLLRNMASGLTLNADHPRKVGTVACRRRGHTSGRNGDHPRSLSFSGPERLRIGRRLRFVVRSAREA